LHHGHPCYTANVRRSVPILAARWLSLLAGQLLGGWCAAAAILGCAACPNAPENAPQQSATSAPRIETTEIEGHPRLRLVMRDAETRVVAALAVSVDGGAQIAFALAGLTEQRLRNAGFAVSTQAHALGYSLQAPLDDAAAVQRFIARAVDALVKPVAPAEPLRSVRLRAAQLRNAEVGQELVVDQCSAEPLLAPGQVALAADDRLAHQQLEAWRRLQTADTAALALAGPSKLLSEARDALEETPEMAASPNASARDPWPAQDSIGVGAPVLQGARLSIALRNADLARTLSLAPRLKADPLLRELLGSLDTPWSIERITAIARPRGACLRVDLHSESPAPDALQTSRLARWLVDYAARVPIAANPWAVQEAITSQGDPTDATRVAAWLALSAQLEPGPARSAIRIDLPADRKSLGETFVGGVRAPSPIAPFSERTLLEPGHSTLSVLIASPCGTAGETSRDAGKRATLLTAIAAAASSDDFVLSPWITPDAVGLLVQSHALNGAESAQSLAERTARRIALALLTPLDGASTAGARQEILNQLVGPDPDLSHLLSVLSGGQPAALEPRGSWTSVDALGHDDIDAARRELIGEPLRVAVLGNQAQTQGAQLTQELSRLLAPLRGTRSECPAAPALAPTSFGQWHLEPSSPPRAPALVAVPLPGADSALGPSEAEWLAYLFNRKGGWLEQHLLAPHLVSAAVARIWGGRRGRALTIELFASPEQVDAAVLKTRTLLHDLSRGAVLSANDVASATQFFQSERNRLQHDRRQRIVSLWRGSATPAAPSLAALQRYQAAAFSQDRQLVVLSEPAN
jgi:hypothetical protein